MEIEDLPEDLREMVESLRHGSNTIECDVKDALEIASDVDDFRERVCCEIDSLIGEAQEDYEKRIIEAYGELVDEQHGKEEILMTEAEVVE